MYPVKITDFTYFFQFPNPEYHHIGIRTLMIFKQMMFLITILILIFFHQQLPFAFPQLFVVCSIGFLGNLALQILFTIKKSVLTLKWIIPGFNLAIAPFIFQFSGGFLSPFSAIYLFDLLMYPGNGLYLNNGKGKASLNRTSETPSTYKGNTDRIRSIHQEQCLEEGSRWRIQRNSPILLAIGYSAVAFLQKFHILSNAVPYAHDMMQNDSFFYFIVFLISFLMFGGVFISESFSKILQRAIIEQNHKFTTIIRGCNAVIDDHFFSTIAHCCMQIVNMRCVCIAAYIPQHSQIKTLGIWHDGKVITDFRLPLETTFANEIITYPEIRFFNSEMIKKYPNDPLAGLFPIISFYGVPLKDSGGEIIGVFYAFHDSPLQNDAQWEPYLSILISRAAVELERKISSERSSRKEELLFQNQKMHAISRLAGDLAHDFNNIISAISGYTSLLKKRLSPDDRNFSYIDRILDAGRHASVITNHLSMAVKNEVPKIEPVDTHMVINTTISLMQAKYGKHVHVTTSLTAQPLLSCGDETQFRDIIMKLGSNAYDACVGVTGTISISTSTVTLNEHDILCQSFSITEGTYVRITVCDNGCGMSTSTLSHLFEPFFSTKSTEKGTGLGLTAVWRYIKTYKGAIEVVTAPDKGSSFIVYLPLFRKSEEIPGEPSEHPPLAPSILLVDNEPSLRDIYSEILIDNGYTVYSCGNGNDVLDFIKIRKKNIDLIILEMEMPRMNGLKLFRAIRAIRPDIKIILMSSLADNEYLTKLLNEHDTQFIQRPCEDEQLIQKVRSMLSSLMKTG